MKMCEQILKKDSSPIQFKFFELQKTTMSPIIAAIASRLEIKKHTDKGLNFKMLNLS